METLAGVVVVSVNLLTQCGRRVAGLRQAVGDANHEWQAFKLEEVDFGLMSVKREAHCPRSVWQTPWKYGETRIEKQREDA